MRETLPSSTIELLSNLPSDSPVTLLLRHSIRTPLAADDVGYELPITEAGQRIAIEFGATLGSKLKSLHSSPLARCKQTAEAIKTGSSTNTPIKLSNMLGDPGPYVIDGEAAWSSFKKLGNKGVIHYLSNNDEPLPGMAAPAQATATLIEYCFEISEGAPGVHVLVTHDSILATALSRIFSINGSSDELCPLFMEAVFFYHHSNGRRAAYRSFKVNLT